jgi:hypothetical protein
MTKILLLFLTLAVLTGISGIGFDSAFGQTPENFKVAFIGDQGYYEDDAELVLQLIASESTDMVLHQGDFDYNQNSTNWDNMITSELGLNFPYFASVGNHDLELNQWPNYQQKLQERLDRIDGADCTGDLGNKSSCHYQGLFFILSGIGTIGSGTSGSTLTDHVDYIENELAQDNSIWSLCTWHKNHQQMQVGGKGTEVSMQVYDACREGGAIIATGHEHSYSRTKTLTNMVDGSGNVQITVDPAWSDPGEVRVADGATFVFVSGLGGKSVRDQERCLPQNYPYGCNGEWASIYSATQDSRLLSGALFCEFNYNGQEDKAFCYFKNTEGQTIDEFNITSFMGVEIPPEPPVTYNQTVSTFESIPIDISLSASDANGDPLTYTIVSGPSSGSLSGTDSFRTYTPNPGFTGSDNFTFKVNDGTADSNVSTVTITVDAIPPSGTLNIRVNSGNDDVEESSSGSMYITSSDLELVDDSTSNGIDQTVGIRFTDIILPQGSTITSAYIEFETDTTDSVSTSLTIHAQDSDDAPAFSSATNNVSSREKTSASFTWEPSEWNTVSEKHQTPDDSLEHLVQEVVDRPGWIPGNDMVFIITGTGTRTAEAYEGESANAPLLHIEYDNTTPNTTPTVSNPMGDVNVNEDALNTIIDLTLHFDDLEDGSAGLEYSVFSNDTPTLVGTLITDDTLTLSYTANTSGSANITIQATDSGLESVEDAFVVSVTSVNDEPSFTTLGDQSVNQNSGPATVLEFATFNPGAADEASQTPTYILSNNNNSLFSAQPSVNSEGTLTFTAATDASGSADVTISVQDSGDTTNGGDNTSTEQIFTITVNQIVDVSNVDFGVSSEGNKRWTGIVNIIVSSIEGIIANADVQGIWSNGANDSCTTDSDGLQCVVSEKTRESTLTFTVTSITGTGISYQPPTPNDSVTFDKYGIIGEDTTAPITTASPSGGTYNSPQQVSLNANEEATIYYTTDGSDPTTSSTEYSSSISIPTTTTLKFFAVDLAGNIETVNIEDYIINESSENVEVHVGTLGGDLSQKGPWNVFTVTILVQDSSDVGKGNVLVSGLWTNFDPKSCTTDSDGTCQIQVRDKTISSTTFTVNSLSGDGIVDDPALIEINRTVTIP